MRIESMRSKLANNPSRNATICAGSIIDARRPLAGVTVALIVDSKRIRDPAGAGARRPLLLEVLEDRLQPVLDVKIPSRQRRAASAHANIRFDRVLLEI